MGGQNGAPGNGGAQNFLAAGSNQQNYMPRQAAGLKMGGGEGLKMPGMGVGSEGSTPGRMRQMGMEAGVGMQAPAGAMTPSFGQPDDVRRQQIAQMGMMFGQQMLQRNQGPALTPQAPQAPPMPALMQQPQAPAALNLAGNVQRGGLANIGGQFNGFRSRPAFGRG